MLSSLQLHDKSKPSQVAFLSATLGFTLCFTRARNYPTQSQPNTMLAHFTNTNTVTACFHSTSKQEPIRHVVHVISKLGGAATADGSAPTPMSASQSHVSGGVITAKKQQVYPGYSHCAALKCCARETHDRTIGWQAALLHGAGNQHAWSQVRRTLATAAAGALTRTTAAARKRGSCRPSGGLHLTCVGGTTTDRRQ